MLQSRTEIARPTVEYMAVGGSKTCGAPHVLVDICYKWRLGYMCRDMDGLNAFH